MPHELPIPPAAESDCKSSEMIRLWLAKGKLQCVLNIGIWEAQKLDELQSWGILLADFVHHIANAHQEEYGRDPEESIRIICKAFDVEMEHPTSSRLGEFVTERNDGSR